MSGVTIRGLEEVVDEGYYPGGRAGHSSLFEAANFVQAVEHRQGLMIACPEEIALQCGYITVDQVRQIARTMGRNEYGAYLLRFLEDPLRHM